MNICVFKNYRSRSWDLAQLVKHLSLEHENLSAAPRTHFGSSAVERCRRKGLWGSLPNQYSLMSKPQVPERCY